MKIPVIKIPYRVKQKIRSWRFWLKTGTTLALVYATLSAVLLVAMKQQPTQFAAVMAKLPMVSMIVLPFEPLWNIARAGQLKLGDGAPDFRLQSYDKSSWVQLSAFRGDRPVVLIFGSYT